LAHNHRKGRKRKPGPRAKSGRLSEAYTTIARNLPTPELQRKRQLLVGDGADPTLSATSIGRIFSYGYLDEKDVKGEVIPEVARERLEAAERYRRLRSAVFGSPWPSNVVGPDASAAQLAPPRRLWATLSPSAHPAAEALESRQFRYWAVYLA
jgi:hypothetical protein